MILKKWISTLKKKKVWIESLYITKVNLRWIIDVSVNIKLLNFEIRRQRGNFGDLEVYGDDLDTISKIGSTTSQTFPKGVNDRNKD